MVLAFGAITQPMFTAVQVRVGALNTVLQENVAGLKVVKAFNREVTEQQRFERAADDLLHQQLKVASTFCLRQL